MSDVIPFSKKFEERQPEVSTESVAEWISRTVIFGRGIDANAVISEAIAQVKELQGRIEGRN